MKQRLENRAREWRVAVDETFETATSLIAYGRRDEDPRNTSPSWSPVKRVLFRFAFSYLVLYTLPFPLHRIPWAGPIITQLMAALLRIQRDAAGTPRARRDDGWPQDTAHTPSGGREILPAHQPWLPLDQ